jgi:hypothetical protein
MNKHFTQGIKLTAANIKRGSEIPGRIIRPGGADNPAPSKISSTTCCCNQFDSEGNMP